jgi:hypothetical protein
MLKGYLIPCHKRTLCAGTLLFLVIVGMEKWWRQMSSSRRSLKGTWLHGKQ